jgi:acyl-CoA thioester hydrolase
MRTGWGEDGKTPMTASPRLDTAIRMHRTELRVPLFEVDLGQAVYHGNYFHLFELGREDFLRELGYPYRRFMEQELHLTVVELSCAYRKAVHYDELIEVRTSVSWQRSRSLAFQQSIHRKNGTDAEELCTSATLNMVCVHFTGRPTVLPKDFVGLLQGYADAGSATGRW